MTETVLTGPGAPVLPGAGAAGADRAGGAAGSDRAGGVAGSRDRAGATREWAADAREWAGEALEYVGLARRDKAEAGDRAYRIYLIVMSVLVLGSMLAQGWRTAAIEGPVARRDPDLLAAALSIAVAGGVLVAAARLGPVGASAPWLTWLLSGPGSRAVTVRRRLVAGIGLAAGVGAVLGVAVGLLVGLSAAAVAGAALAGASLGALLVAVAAGAQVRRRDGYRSPMRAGMAVAAVGLALVVAERFGVGPVTPTGPWWLPLAVAGALLVGAVAVSFGASRRLDSLGDAELRRGGALVAAGADALTNLDTGVLSAALESSGQRTGRVARRPGARVGALAVAHRDLRSLTPQRLLVVVPAALLTVLAARVLGPAIGAIVAGVLVAWPAKGAGRALALWASSAGLRRAFPLSDSTIRLALTVAPALVSAATAVVATALSGMPVLTAVGMAFAGTAAAIAFAVPRDLDAMAFMIPTPAGNLPASALTAVRGWDLAGAAMLGFALGRPALGVAVAAAVCVGTWVWATSKDDPTPS